MKEQWEINVEKRRELENWVINNLPEVRKGNFIVQRFEVEVGGEVVIINKPFYKEVANKYKQEKDYPERLEIAKRAHLLIQEAKFSHYEEPRHHKGVVAVFEVYEKEIDGITYEFKVKKQEDGRFLYFLQKKKR